MYTFLSSFLLYWSLNLPSPCLWIWCWDYPLAGSFLALRTPSHDLYNSWSVIRDATRVSYEILMLRNLGYVWWCPRERRLALESSQKLYVCYRLSILILIFFKKKCIHLVEEKIKLGWWFWVLVDGSFVFGLKLKDSSLEILSPFLGLFVNCEKKTSNIKFW